MKHEQTFIEGTNDTLIVFIHGFLGSPSQFIDLAEVFHKRGFSILSLLLPGHGGKASSFASAGINEWQGYVDQQVEKHTLRYRNIFLVGHSIGGLLSLNASVKLPKAVNGVFMISSPLRLLLFNPRAALTRFSIYLLPGNRTKRQAYWDAKSVGWLCFLSIKPYLGVLHLMEKTQKNLSNVTVPVVAVHSLRDELVKYRSAAMFRSGISEGLLESYTIKHSLHAYYPPEERKFIYDILTDFIEKMKDRK